MARIWSRNVCLIRSQNPVAGPTVRLGVPELDEYLEFMAGRCRPNTVLAVGYELQVVFRAVGEPPDQVTMSDV